MARPTARPTAAHVARVEASLATNAPARSALAASWRRSSEHHKLDPAATTSPQQLGDSELRHHRDAMGPLLEAARPALDRLYQAVGGSGCCVLLADRNGVPVDRRGAAVDDPVFRGWGLWTGAVWDEGAQGTNGIGTCLIEHRLLTIHRDQHFLAKNASLSCSAAPIWCPDAKLAGVLDVSSCRADVTDGFVDLIRLALADAARRIEAEVFRRAFPDARIVLTENGGLLAVDRDDLVVGATRAARQTLGLTADRLGRPLPARDLLEAERPCESLDHAERAVLARALARANGNVSAAAAALGISRATLHRKLKRDPAARPARAN
ncbi:MAG: helix-turn-helix domain-containing protein [Amaricoccus sp.]|uniref:GAF domain-containing protein n=1 Tax=Amaricoccus sp. TaxID=1872485 RepID=UPI0039E691EC